MILQVSTKTNKTFRRLRRKSGSVDSLSKKMPNFIEKVYFEACSNSENITSMDFYRKTNCPVPHNSLLFQSRQMDYPPSGHFQEYY